jgi:hypothetical protein
MARLTKRLGPYPTETVFAAAVAAQIANKEYVKAGEITVEKKKSNRELMLDYLNNPEVLTEQDKQRGQEVRQYFQGLTFKVLKGKELGGFEQAALDYASQSEITSLLEISVIASLPQTHKRSLERDARNQRLEYASGGFIGKPKDRVSLDIEVVKTNFSNLYQTYFISALTTEDQPIFFSYKAGMIPGTKGRITGTVKAHRDYATQLNRVKVVD